MTGIVISGFSPPQKRKLKYDDILPNVGFTFDITPRISVFASYAKGLSVPGTDNLYNAFFFPAGSDAAKPDPETTDSFDGGLRYRSSKVQAQFSVWKTAFKNRTASAYDPELDANVFRNLGSVDKWGIDGSVAYAPVRQLTLYAFGSINRSKIKDNIQIGRFLGLPAGTTCDNIPTGTAAQLAVALRSCAFTAGKTEAGSPRYSYGLSSVATLGPVDLGITAKRTGPRFVYDNNAANLPGRCRYDHLHGNLSLEGSGILAGQPRCPLQPEVHRAQGNLLPAQRLQPVRRGLRRRFRRRPEPVSLRGHPASGRFLRNPGLRPDRCAAHHFGHAQPVLLSLFVTMKTASPSGGAVFICAERAALL